MTRPLLRALVAALTLSAIPCFNASAAAAPMPPATNGSLAFSRALKMKDLWPTDNAIVSLTPGGVLNHLTPAGTDSVFPSYSWDGTKITFVRSAGDESQIMRMNANGAGAVAVTAPDGWQSTPAFTPDGTRIVYASDEDGDLDIYSVKTDGTQKTNLTKNGVEDSYPSVGPSGEIYFQRSLAGGSEIFRMSATGGGVTQLTDSPFGANQNPSVSRSGTRVTFASTRGGAGADIFVMNADGSGETALTEDGKGNMAPVFSPDNKMIAWCSNRDGTSFWEYDIYTMRADGTSRKRVTFNKATDVEPTWQPVIKIGSLGG